MSFPSSRSISLFLRKARIALTPKGSHLTTRLEDGTILSGQSLPGWGGRGIYLWREDYEPEFRHLPKLLQRGQVFLDIGANVGVFSMRAATIVGPSGIVVAVEPFPEMIRAIWRNVKLNQFEQVRIRQGVVSDALGEKTFWMNREMPNSFSLERSDHQSRAFSVLSMRVDDLVGWERLERLDYLKIDAEGAESLILQGATKSLQRFRPIIQAEATLAEVTVPEEYRPFRFPNSPNMLLVPGEHAAISVLQSLGAASC